MIDTLFGQLASYGISEAIRLLSEACALAIKKISTYLIGKESLLIPESFLASMRMTAAPFLMI